MVALVTTTSDGRWGTQCIHDDHQRHGRRTLLRTRYPWRNPCHLIRGLEKAPRRPSGLMLDFVFHRWSVPYARETTSPALARHAKVGGSKQQILGAMHAAGTTWKRIVQRGKATQRKGLQDNSAARRNGIFWPGLTYLQDSASLRGRCSAYGMD